MKLRENKKMIKACKKETQSMMIIRSVGKFIRHNKNLQFIDLEYTGLSHAIFCGLIPEI